MTYFVRRGIVDVSDGDSGRSIGDDDVYRGRIESVLVLFSDLYSDDKISISDSRPSFCFTYTVY